MPDNERSRPEAPLRDTSSLSKSFLEKAADTALREVKAEIRRTAFKSVPSDLLSSFESEVRGGQIIIRSSHPAASYLNNGVKAYQMTHLTKARRPIPIVTDNGQVVFRTATQASMRSGAWKHPGFEGKNFIERGAQRALKIISAQALEMTRQRVASRFGVVGKKYNR